MTISIKIKNTDSRAEAIVTVKTQAPGGEPTDWNPPIMLKGGEEVEKYVHSGQKLIVEEVKNG